MKKLYKIIFAISVLAITASSSFASHIAGADINWVCLGNDQYLVTLNIFRDCFGIAAPTSPNVTFTSPCGTFNQSLILMNPGGTEVSQLCPADSLSSTCSNGTLPGMEHYFYESIVTMTPCAAGPWVITWSNCCRNAAIVNLVNATSTMTVQASVYNQNDTCNTSPTFTAQPIPYVCLNQPVSYSYGTTEVDGDSLSYSLVCAEDNAGCLAYNAPYSILNPINGITINSSTGQLNFTPTTLGNFVVVVEVVETDPITGDTVGIIERDIQFIVIQCSNTIPDINAGTLDTVAGGIQTGPYAIDICNGDTLTFCMTFTDTNSTDTLSVTTNLDSVLLGATWTTTGTNPLVMCVTWPVPGGFNNPNTSFFVTIDDGACPIVGQQTYVYDINVTGAYAGPDQIICGQNSQWPGQAFLQASGGSTYIWTVLSGDPIVIGTNFTCDTCDTTTATPSITTTYLVTTNLGVNCNSDSVTVFVVPDFNYTITQSDLSLCLLDSVHFNVTPNPVGNYTYQWHPSSWFNNDTISNPTAGFSNPGVNKVWFDIISADGCLKSDTFYITVSPNPVPSIVFIGDTTLCEGDTTELCAINLNGGADLMDEFDPGIDSSMWTSISGAVASNNCTSVSGNALWFGVAAPTREAQTIDLNTTAGGDVIFYLLISDGTIGISCEDADPGEEVVLEYSNNGGGSWTLISTYSTVLYPNFTLITEPIPAAAQTNATRFRWMQIGTYGPTIDNWALDSVVVNIFGGGSITYDWLPNYNINPLDSACVNIWPAVDTTYIVIATDSIGGCVDTASIKINVVPNFNIFITQNDTIICLGDSVDFTVNTDTLSNPIINWTPGGILTNDSVFNPTGGFVIPDTSWVYVEVSNQFGCAQFDSTYVIASHGAKPNLSIIGDSTLCAGDSTELCAINLTAGDSCYYVIDLFDSFGDGWNGALLDFYVNGTIAGSFTFVTGNSLIDSVAVFHGDTVNIVMTSGGFPAEESFVIYDCLGDTAYFDGPSPINGNVWGENVISTLGTDEDVVYSWSPLYNGIFGDTTKVWVFPSVDTTYTIIALDTIGNCSDTASFNVYVVPNFNISITQNDTIICLFDSVEFTLVYDTVSNPIVVWEPGPIFADSTALIATAGFNCPDTAYVQAIVTNQFGCSKDASAFVIVSNVPEPKLVVSGDMLICEGDTASFCATDTSSSSGCSNLTEDFENGISTTFWDNTTGLIDPSCGSPAGTNVLWMGPVNGLGERIAETVDFNVAFSAATLSFWFKLAASGSAAPCEDADILGAEDVNLEYSLNGGGTWLPMVNYPAGPTNIYGNWTFLTVLIPLPAQTNSTRFRWIQSNPSSANNDHWAIEDITVTTSGGGAGGYLYTWSPSFNLSSPDSICTNGWPNTTTTYTVSVVDTFAGCGDTVQHIVTVLPQPSVNILNTATSFCFNDSSSTFVGTPTPGTWTGNGITAGGTFDPSSAGNGVHQLVYNHNNGACDGWDTILVTVNPNPAPPSAFADNPYCEGDNLSGISVNGAGGSFIWYNDANLTDVVNDPNDENATGQTFYVVEVSTNGCVSNATSLNIITVPVPDADISSDYDPNNNQAPITIDFENETSPLNGNSYEWSINGDDKSNDVDFSYEFTESGLYLIVLEAVENTIGCSDTAQIIIEIRKFWIEEFPNVFTPDGDGFNDVFNIRGEGLTEVSMVIYNRWGRKVYECGPTDDWRSCSWDGSGRSDGTYYYTIEASDDKRVPVLNRTDFQGYIQLINKR